MQFLVIDPGGLYVENANALADKGKNKVFYYTNWPSAYPRFNDYAPGLNFDHLTKVKWIDQAAEEADCIVNFDVHMNDWIVVLKKLYPKKSIFGAGLGERIEADRWFLKKLIKQLGLPIMKADKIHGLTRLKEFIKTNPDKYIKADIFRSEDRGINSFNAKSFDTAEEIFKEIATAFGPFDDEIDFIVEEKIKSDVEVGFDGFYSAGVGYGENAMVGYEYEKSCYVAVNTKIKDLPVPLAETMTKFSKVLDIMDYRGAISTEEKIVDKLRHYLLDVCSRLPSPCGDMYCLSKNYPEMVNNIGLKKPFKLDIPFKYVAVAPIECQHAENHWVRIILDKKDRENVKLKTTACVDGKYYAVPGHSTVAVIIAGGNTVDEVINLVKKYSEKVSGYGLSSTVIKDFDSIKEEINKGRKLGINF